MHDFSFETAKKIIVKKSGVSSIGEILSEYNFERILVIADAGIKKAGHIQKISDSCCSNGMRCFDFTDICSDPKEAMVYAAAYEAIEKSVDCIVGIGGGSVMDVSKAASILAKSKGSLKDIYGIGMVKGGRLPLVLIPTTAGTGSEATSSAVISNECGQKNVVIDPALYPDVALLDVDMLSTMPPHIASTTGVDAIVHAIEAYTSATKKNPFSDMLACEALRYLMGNIEPSLQEEATDEIRFRMLLGATLAGQAFANASVSAVHAFAYALAESFHLSHGLSNALVMLPIVKFNIVTSPELYGCLAKAVFPSMAGKTDAEAADYFVTQLQAILEVAGLNKGLRGFGIKEVDLDSLAKSASSQKRLLKNNPRSISLEGARQIFADAY